MSKFKPELMYTLADEMTTSVQQIEEINTGLMKLMENSKEVWNDEISIKFFEEISSNMDYLKKFINIIPQKSKQYKEGAEILDRAWG